MHSSGHASDRLFSRHIVSQPIRDSDPSGSLPTTYPSNLVREACLAGPQLHEPGADVDVQTDQPIFPVSSAISGTSGPACYPAAPCSMETVDPNFKNPRSVQWNVDLQRALTNNLTLDVAYVGVHGYDETHSVDLNEPALGVGWDPTRQFSRRLLRQNCLGGTPGSPVAPTQFEPHPLCADKPLNRPPGPTPPSSPISRTLVKRRSGFISNYDALLVTLDRGISTASAS